MKWAEWQKMYVARKAISIAAFKNSNLILMRKFGHSLNERRFDRKIGDWFP
jgi:hypothetical protein